MSEIASLIAPAAIPLPWQTTQWQRLLKQFRQQQLAHAYLFSGASGTGKTLLASRFAQMLLCLAPEDDAPCGHCKQCQAGGGYAHPDILRIAPEEGSRDIKVEQVRAITDFVARTSFAGSARVILVSMVHRMNISASNALLKTLEEPGKNTFLFLITDLPGYLSATIRSRCQRLQFPAPGLADSERWLNEQVTAEIDAAALLSATHNQPLRALELASTDAVADQQQFWSQLADVVRGSSSPQVLVSLGMRLGEMAAVEYLLQASTTLVKAMLARNDTSAAKGNEALQTLEKTVLAQSDTTETARRLMALYQDALEARKQLLGTANPNGQLILESLAYRCSHLIR